MSTRASDIALALSERVATITVANGYETDIGSTVFRGKLSLDPASMPCLVMVEGEDSVLEQKFADVRLQQKYIFEGHMALTEGSQVDNPNDVAHLILADLKKCLFGGDRTLGGLINKNDIRYVGRNIGTREDGQALIAASVEIDVVYVENLSNP